MWSRGARLLLVLAITAHAAPELSDLDAILRKAGSVSGFLSRPDLVDEYYLAAAEYYGGTEKFPRVSYDAVLAQLRSVLPKAAGLEARLWETPQDSHLGTAFRVQSVLKSTGRRLDARLWEDRLTKLRDGLSDDGKVYPNPQAISSLVDRQVKTLRGSEAYRNAGRNERERLDAELMKRLRADSTVQAAARRVARDSLENPELRHLLANGDADLVIAAWEAFLAHPGAYAGSSEREWPSVVESEARRLLPSVKSLLADATLFPPAYFMAPNRRPQPMPAAGPAVYEARVLPRRFHSIFKGIRLSECVGGACGDLNSLTPERTLTGALRDAEILYLERNGKHLGFFEAVPGRIGTETVASISFGAPEFRNLIYSYDEHGRLSSRALYSIWIEKVDASKPKDWRALVVSSLDNLNNAGVLPDLRKSSHYIFGRKEKLAPGAFTLDEPLAKVIPRLLPRQGHAALYGGAWVLDATAMPNESRVLTRLEASPALDLAKTRALVSSGDLAPIAYLARRAVAQPNAAETATFLPFLIEQGDGGTHWTIAQFVLPKLDPKAARIFVAPLIERANPATLNALALHFFSSPASVGSEDMMERLVQRGGDEVLASLERVAFAFPRPRSEELRRKIRARASISCVSPLSAIFGP